MKPKELTEPQIAELREILALVTEAHRRYRDNFANRGLYGDHGRDPETALFDALLKCQARLDDGIGQGASKGKSIGFS